VLVNVQTTDLKAPFKAYISALLDIIGDKPAANEGVVDRLGKPEILFLGPDENTADVMDWACYYARDRGYPYWRAFTTGKSTGLGGIPHDRCGLVGAS
jgi:glutamate dehydrogenase